MSGPCSCQFVLDLLLLTLGMVIFPDPGVQCVFIHAKVTRRLGNGLSRLHSQFDRPLLEFRGIFFRRSWLIEHTSYAA